MEEWTLEQYATRFVAAVRTRRRPRTVEKYEAVLATHVIPSLGATTPLAAITRPMVRGFVVERLAAGYAPGTVKCHVKVLRALLMEAVEDELLDACPAVRIARLFPKDDSQPRDKALPRAGLEALLERAFACYPRLALLLVVLARTGTRIGELLGVTWADVDLEGRVLHIRRSLDWKHRVGPPKGGRARAVDLGRDACAALEELARMREPGVPWVFTSTRGRPWCRSHIRRKLERLCSLVGLPPCGVHVFRHSFATHLVDRGVETRVVMELLGHHSVTVTEKYIGQGKRHRTAVARLDSAVVDGQATRRRRKGA